MQLRMMNSDRAQSHILRINFIFWGLIVKSSWTLEKIHTASQQYLDLPP